MNNTSTQQVYDLLIIFLLLFVLCFSPIYCICCHRNINEYSKITDV